MTVFAGFARIKVFAALRERFRSCDYFVFHVRPFA
jgi:hypothetical protein